jgi:clan AA aspartic protease
MTCSGLVTGDLEATVVLNVLPAQGDAISVTAVIDTGFNGYLTLPAETIESLALRFHSYTEAELGDGHTIVLRKFEGEVLWNGLPRAVTILQTQGAPLVGMALLEKHRICIDVIPQGNVAIDCIRNSNA